MSEMFYGCTKLGSLDVSGFDTENVEIIRDIFNGCENIEELDISLFATSNVENMDNMFDGMNMLAEIALGKNFFFNGKKCWLPTPSDAYIPGQLVNGTIIKEMNMLWKMFRTT